MECRSKSRTYPSPIYPGAPDRVVVACSDQVGISRCLRNVPSVTRLLPGVVRLGEIPPQFHEIEEVVEKADLAIVVGTSSTVRHAKEVC